MATQVIRKVLSLPEQLEPNAQYQVKEGDKLVIYVTNSSGTVASRTISQADLTAVENAAAADATAKAAAAQAAAASDATAKANAAKDAAAIDATAKANAAKQHAEDLVDALRTEMNTLAGSPVIEQFMLQ